ncbi:MAG: CinA family nicotinamide mononucleotide deamidase-related protein [Planctomycetes bacterium]|nr:CinA family nicotinamide mononucleotide deamidase-related protein [Planctomycetota bacterium]
MHAEIIAIGDEITSGQLLDTNTQWLSRRIEDLGIAVPYHTAVGDDLDAMTGVFRAAIGRAGVVVITGGLGPTADDLTRQALARATGCPLARKPEALDHIRAIFVRLGRRMPPSNEVQAMFPAGSRMIDNPNGTAPGIEMEIGDQGESPCRVFALPGVPAEMKEMWDASVAGALLAAGAGNGVIRHRVIKCFGGGESQVEAMLPDLIRRGRSPTVGITASQATILLRITAQGATEAACQAAMEPTVATIRRCLGPLVFGEGDDQLQDALVGPLRKSGRTLATTEWGTGGLVAQWLHAAKGAEPCYRGGLVTADRIALETALNIPRDLVDRHTAGSAEVTAAAARRCREIFQSDLALAVGPFPEPDPDASRRQVVHVALAGPEEVTVKPLRFAGHPALLQISTAKRALNFARLELGFAPEVSG